MTTRDSEVDSVLRAVSAAPPAEPPQETPQLGDRYALKKEIGRGGMGRVFLAQDRRLGRDVAIKLLATGAPGGERLLRFEQEARAVASLSHPNIITVFDVGVSAGAPYIVSELLRGGTLREKLSGTTLQPKEALDYAGQLAQGLVAAHEKGIVHRDLKPDNLFITEEGRLKILDFGIAKLLAPLAETERTATLTPDLASRAASPTPTERFIAELAPASPEAPTPQSLGADDTPRTPRTATGTVLGTVGYMSPEQVRGEPADPRSDLFAFGAIVYEMLAGQRAFKRGNQQATDYAILHDEPPGLPASVPKALGRLVQRCLKKDPAGRFQSARELAAELAQLRLGWSRAWKLGALVGAVLLVALAAVALLQPVPAARAGRLTLAAADFVNDTKEEELDGLSGMLITSLEQSKRLSVLTRGRMFDILKGLGRGDAARIDEKLGREISAEASADVLALGSIRRFGALYSIDLKLIDPVKNVLLFAASERGTGRESIPGMLDRLSERTRAALQEKEEDIRAANVGVAHSTTANLEAYQHYFLAEELRARGREVQAIAELRLAIQADPRFALAHFSLGASFEFLGVRDLASELAEFETALRLGLPPREKCWAQAEITVAHDRSPRALELIDSCVERFPNDKRLLFVAASWVLYDLARKERYLTRAVGLDPTYQPVVELLITTLQEQGRAAEALERAADYSARTDDVESRIQLATAQLFAGQRPLGLTTLREAARLFPASTRPVKELVQAFLVSGQPAQAALELQPLLERAARGGAQPDLETTIGHLRLLLDVYGGRFRAAIAHFEAQAARAREAKSPLALGWALAWKGFLLVGGPGDRVAARETVAQLEAIDVPADFAFLLDCILGDFERADALAAARPGFLVDLQQACEADRASARGARAEALAGYGLVAQVFTHGDRARYRLIELALEAGEPRKALEAARRVQTSYRTSDSVPYLFALWFPRSFQLEGRAREQLGDTRGALAAYEKFLQLWSDADPDLAELRDAKARVAALRARPR